MEELKQLHNALAQHFNQKTALPVKLYIEGHNEVLAIEPNGDSFITFQGRVYPKELKELYLGDEQASTLELIQFLERHSSILIKVQANDTIYDQ